VAHSVAVVKALLTPLAAIVHAALRPDTTEHARERRQHHRRQQVCHETMSQSCAIHHIL